MMFLLIALLDRLQSAEQLCYSKNMCSRTKHMCVLVTTLNWPRRINGLLSEKTSCVPSERTHVFFVSRKHTAITKRIKQIKSWHFDLDIRV